MYGRLMNFFYILCQNQKKIWITTSNTDNETKHNVDEFGYHKEIPKKNVISLVHPSRNLSVHLTISTNVTCSYNDYSCL